MSAAPPDDPYAEDASLAATLAGQAVALLEALHAELGTGGLEALRAAGDRRSHEFLMAALAEARPGDAVLSEEGADDRGRLTADRVWIVDPLDGTREFGEGRSDWAVHVALWHAAPGRLVAAAVGLAGGAVLATDPVPAPPPPHDGPPRVVASRTRAPAVVDDVVSALGGQKVPLGSAGAKIAAVIRGDAEVYVHSGGQYEWDSAAPVAVARAAGLAASRLDGSPLLYNQPEPYLPDLVVCRPELADLVLEIVRTAG